MTPVAELQEEWLPLFSQRKKNSPPFFPSRDNFQTYLLQRIPCHSNQFPVLKIDWFLLLSVLLLSYDPKNIRLIEREKSSTIESINNFTGFSSHSILFRVDESCDNSNRSLARIHIRDSGRSLTQRLLVYRGIAGENVRNFKQCANIHSSHSSIAVIPRRLNIS